MSVFQFDGYYSSSLPLLDSSFTSQTKRNHQRANAVPINIAPKLVWISIRQQMNNGERQLENYVNKTRYGKSGEAARPSIRRRVPIPEVSAWLKVEQSLGALACKGQLGPAS